MAEQVEHRPGTLVQLTRRKILQHIRENELRVGDQLPSEAHFCTEFGVSRTVVRESFKSLSALGIVDMNAGRRAQVASFDGSVIDLTVTHALRTGQLNVHQIAFARRSIELSTAELAAVHRTPRELEKLKHLCARMRDNYLDLELITQADIDFHVSLAEASRNPLLAVLVRSLSGAVRETNPLVWRYRRSDIEKMEIVEVHERVLEAIAANDPDSARAAMVAHFTVATKGLIDAGVN